MSDEIERARAVLSAASERHLRISDDDRAGMLLDAIALDMLAVVEAADALDGAPLTDLSYQCPKRLVDPVFDAVNALRARLREHLGSEAASGASGDLGGDDG